MQNESWRERFEKQFSEVKFIEFDKGAWSNDVKKYHDKEIMAFIASELNLAKQEERSQLLQEIEERVNKLYPATFIRETSYGEGVFDSGKQETTHIRRLTPEEQVVLSDILTIINSF